MNDSQDQTTTTSTTESKTYTITLTTNFFIYTMIGLGGYFLARQIFKKPKDD